MVMIVGLMDLNLHLQSVPVTTEVNWIPAHGGMYLMQVYVIIFVSEV
jgi:hypothetical protein